MEKVKLLIIGSGPAGYTAAIYASRAALAPVLYEGLEPGGQLTTTTLVENFPGFAEGVDANSLMDQMKRQAQRFGADVRRGMIVSVDLGSRPFRATDDGGRELEADAVIVATGATAKYLGLPSEKKFRGLGVSACATCDGFFYRGKDVAVVGGGDSACEEAHFLTRFASKVYMIHRRDSLRASKAMQQRVLSHEKIEMLWNSTISEYKKGEDGELCGVTLRDTQTGEERPLDVKCVFMAIGHIPNSKIAGSLVDVDEAGFIMRTNGGASTKTPGLFAAGDVADPHYRQAISAAGMGCWAALEAERYLLSL